MGGSKKPKAEPAPLVPATVPESASASTAPKQNTGRQAQSSLLEPDALVQDENKDILG